MNIPKNTNRKGIRTEVVGPTNEVLFNAEQEWPTDRWKPRPIRLPRVHMGTTSQTAQRRGLAIDQASSARQCHNWIGHLETDEILGKNQRHGYVRNQLVATGSEEDGPRTEEGIAPKHE